MATRKEQLDAFNFARRRLVANLVVPTATGSDEGAPRPVKTFATSIILSALAVVAVMVLGVFKPSAPSGWQDGLAVDSSSGATYITQNNELHQVYNITSARLILGTNFAKYDVPDSTLNSSGITIGAPVGILGAPEDVPAAGNMNLTQWSFCQSEVIASGGDKEGSPTYLEIGYGPSASTVQWTKYSGEALIVHDSAGYVYLIDGDYKYYIGDSAPGSSDANNVQTILRAINQNGAFPTAVTGFWVSDAWLGAFAQGTKITFPTLSNLGEKVTSPNQPGDEVGEYGEFNTGSNLIYAVQTENGVLELSHFAYDLYIASGSLSQSHIPQFPQGTLTQSAITEANNPSTPVAEQVFDPNSYGADWPVLPPSLVGTDTSSPTTSNICVGYTGQSEDSVPTLTTWTSSQLPYGTPSSQFGLSQSGSNVEANTVLVKPGYGLLATAPGGEYLIEDSGFRYPLQSGTVSVAGASPSPSATASGSGSSKPVSAIDQLLYTEVKTEPVPKSWLNLLQGGAALNPSTAGQTPQSGS